MLRGAVGTEITWAVIIFVFVILEILLFIQATSVFYEVRVRGIINDVNPTDFVYLVKSVLANNKSEVSYEMFKSTTSLRQLGLAEKNAWLRNLETGEKIQISGDEEDHKHEIYVSLQSDYHPVMHDSKVIMRRNKVYLMNIYENGRHIVVDIYPDLLCSEELSVHGYRIINCNELLTLARDDIKVFSSPGELSHYIENKQSVVVKPVEEDTIAKDIADLAGSHSFGRIDKCLTQRRDRNICFRIMGQYVSPGRLHAEIGPGENFWWSG